MTRILHLTDTHIVAPGALAFGQVDTAACLSRALDRFNQIRDRLEPIDAAIITGDLTDDGAPEAYAHLKTRLDPLDLPLHVVPGNHDARAPLAAAFDLDQDGPLDWQERVGDLLLIGLDSSVAGASHGTLEDASLTFLGEALASQSPGPVLVALHHPPFATGLHGMDRIGLTNAAALSNRLAAYPGPLRVICGHVHRAIMGSCGGHGVLIGPSTAHAVAIDLRPGARNAVAMEPPGMMLHCWDGAVVSHVIPLTEPASPL